MSERTAQPTRDDLTRLIHQDATLRALWMQCERGEINREQMLISMIVVKTEQHQEAMRRVCEAYQRLPPPFVAPSEPMYDQELNNRRRRGADRN